ncbi:hypothetical protein M3Y95_00456600 [Aphelenchoides besseyi]|nr:hypothetical protein M3Y95_00456600 [Aphelenchoides besseyi]
MAANSAQLTNKRELPNDLIDLIYRNYILVETMDQRDLMVKNLEKTANEFAQKAETKKSKSAENLSTKTDVISEGNVSTYTKQQCWEPHLSKQQRYREILLDEYQSCGTPKTAFYRLCRECGPNAMSETTIRRWFCRFDAGNYDLRNKKRKQKQTETTQGNEQKNEESR